MCYNIIVNALLLGKLQMKEGRLMARKYKLDALEDHSTFDCINFNGKNLQDMPATHKQEWYMAEKVLVSGQIDPVLCDVFQESLAYFFYGRPAYCLSRKGGSRGDRLYFPVCFLLDLNAIHIDKVFPFDSGGFAEAMYDGFFHEKMDVNLFSLCPSTTETIKGFIDYFYGNNDLYYRNEGRFIDSTLSENLEFQSFVNFFNNRGEEKFDERCSTIEIISKTPAALSESLIAVIVPVGFKTKHEKTLQELRGGTVDIITYNTFGGDPGSYNGVIRDKLYEYLCRKGFISTQTKMRCGKV
jgi:hypothetical protein